MLRSDLMLASLFVLSSLAVVPSACSSSVGESPSAKSGAAGASLPNVDPGASAGMDGDPSGGYPDQPEVNAGAGGARADAGASSIGDAGARSDAGGPSAGSGGFECVPVVEEQALSAGNHVATCSEIAYATNPPSSGEHYPVWGDFGVYNFPLPRGFWVHNLEHGAVVVTYHCPSGCESEVAQATDWLQRLSPDAACPAGPPRVLLVPDPLLDVRWAASAWGFTLKSECFDSAAFSAFYEQHAGQPPAPEAPLCSPGQDLRAPGADTCGAHVP